VGERNAPERADADRVRELSDRPWNAPPESEPESPAPEGDLSEEWAVVRETADANEAELISGLLRSGGIHAQVEKKVFTQEPVPAVTSLAQVLVWVPKTELTQARRVLEESEASVVSCAKCGHALEGPVCAYCAEEEGRNVTE
jgi:ribosomal protein L32